MPVPSSIADLSQTAASNSPAGSESPSTLDDYQRAHAAFIAQHRDGAGYTAEATVASAATADIGAATSFYVQITGTTTITSFGANYNGPRFLRFAAALTLTHNATTLILPGGANINTAAGDTCVVVPNANPATGWRVVSYQRGGGVPFTGTSQLAGLRNKIINGKMEIAQRGTSFAAAAFGAYTVDRWGYFGAASTAVVTVSQQSDAPSDNEFQYSLRSAVTTADAAIAAGDVVHLAQIVEGFNVRDLINRSFVVSFRVRSSKTGTHCVAFRNSGTDRSYVTEYSVSAANTWETKSVSVPAGLITAGTWNWTNGVGLTASFVLAAGTTFQTTANAWQTGNYLATANQVNCLDTIGNIFAITGVQLEVGPAATPFEHLPYGMELALCRRYARSDFVELTGMNATSGVKYASADVSEMRTTPTAIQCYDMAGASGVVTTLDSSANVTNGVAATGFATSGGGAIRAGASLSTTAWGVRARIFSQAEL